MILEGDCRETLKSLAAESVASIVTDPPYEIGFMGKGWDGSGVANDPDLWAECYRVLKPGGHVMAFGAARTYHRMACAIEDAGFEIRDSIHWVYGSGFPKSHNVSKGIDKAAGASREVVGTRPLIGNGKTMRSGFHQADGTGAGETIMQDTFDITAPATDDAKKWEGWGTALKPAHEPIVMARKPFTGTVAQNVLEHGTGALNIDRARIGSNDGYEQQWDRPISTNIGAARGRYISNGTQHSVDLSANKPSGRWPANVILTHSTECGPECTPDCPAREIDRQSGNVKDGIAVTRNGGGRKIFGKPNDGAKIPDTGYGDKGGASRYFAQPEWTPGDYLASVYTPKAGKKERNAGLDGMPTLNRYKAGGVGGTGGMRSVKAATESKPVANHHPTVKPVALMRYLIRLVTPPGGTVLDPFLGSGTTAVAAILEKFEWIGCELTAEYLPIIEARCQWARENIEIPEPTLFDGDTT